MNDEIFALLALGMILLFLYKLVQMRHGRRERKLEEQRAFSRDFEAGFERMEQRIEALETLLLDRREWRPAVEAGGAVRRPATTGAGRPAARETHSALGR